MVGSTLTNSGKNQVMLLDIRSQGDALAEGLALARIQASSWDLPASRRVVLTGSGDSLIAALALRSLFQDYLNLPVLGVPSLEASRYMVPGEGDLVVSISVSGEVARTIEVARRAKGGGATVLAVTADGSSSLATVSDGALTIPAPIDRSIPHCRDYTATLIVLVALLEALVSETFTEADAIPAVTGDLVSRCFKAARSLRLGEGRTWFLGAGPDRATAMFGALKFWEAGMEAWWDDLEEFGHGSQLMARPGDRAVLIAAGGGCQRALEMVEGLERMGLHVVLVGGTSMTSGANELLFTTDELDSRWHPIVACVPLQVLTYVEAEARALDVTVPLFGHPHGPVYDEVHAEWTKSSRIVLGDGS
jgi:glucosamine--fructose-6-phosphate aminotransferase (isomerizing)